MTTNSRMGLAIIGFLLSAGIATFACAERGTSESDAGRSEKDGRRGHRQQPDKSPGLPMEQNKSSDEMIADKGQVIETP